uniref:Uncharacterized protein n=1 Tax=Cacopsylla melanoneura TaxID=428564 RepID=A0A8D8QWL4_9HEMI
MKNKFDKTQKGALKIQWALLTQQIIILALIEVGSSNTRLSEHSAVIVGEFLKTISSLSLVQTIQDHNISKLNKVTHYSLNLASCKSTQRFEELLSIKRHSCD